MNLLFRIIRAAHARGTHHKLALDAIARLDGPDAEAWQRMLLKHADLYMQGAKAPDDEFKDFQNHVLHVREGYWGGAIDKVERWYGHLVDALKGERWSEAVFSAGVLSHYFTDPIHPFHTAQSEAENNIHRAAEWSISRSYDALLREGEEAAGAGVAMPGDGPGWLRELVVQGAEAGNRQYEKLIAHYDIHRGVIDPPTGLDGIARRIVGELIVHAVTGFAIVLSRAIAQSGARPPEVSLTIDTLLAAIQAPAKLWLKRLEDAGERRVVERMYDELKAKGRVEETLPEDERLVRELHAREVLAPQLARRHEQRLEVIDNPAARSTPRSTRAPARTAKAPPALAYGGAPRQEAPKLRLVERVAALQPAAQPARPLELAALGERQPRTWLAPGDDVERAPSIGPKMAERLRADGIRTVADLLATQPECVADALELKHVTADVVADWQDQAQLVMTIPGLRGTHAQLLVGAGYRTRDAVADAAADRLCADVLAFAASSDGQRVLRDGNPPDIERIKGWLESAQAARAA